MEYIWTSKATKVIKPSIVTDKLSSKIPHVILISETTIQSIEKLIEFKSDDKKSVSIKINKINEHNIVKTDIKELARGTLRAKRAVNTKLTPHMIGGIYVKLIPIIPLYIKNIYHFIKSTSSILTEDLFL